MMKRMLFPGAALALLMASVGCTPAPVAEFETSSPDRPAPVEVKFTNKSQNAERYEWSFGDGQTSVEESPAHTYQGFGKMMVQLKAFQGEKVAVDTAFIEIPEPPRRKALIETAFGNITVELSNLTPQHRDNFVKLADQGFYNDLLFHRVMAQFMIQGGDPDSKTAKPGQVLGQGGPGYTIPAEIVPGLLHTKGALSAARLPDQINPEKASSGSQFYIVQGQPMSEQAIAMFQQRGIAFTPEQKSKYLQAGFGAPFLDREYTVFGYVVEGLDVIDKIAQVKTDPNNRPLEDVKMKISMVE